MGLWDQTHMGLNLSSAWQCGPCGKLLIFHESSFLYIMHNNTSLSSIVPDTQKITINSLFPFVFFSWISHIVILIQHLFKISSSFNIGTWRHYDENALFPQIYLTFIYVLFIKKCKRDISKFHQKRHILFSSYLLSNFGGEWKACGQKAQLDLEPMRVSFSARVRWQDSSVLFWKALSIICKHSNWNMWSVFIAVYPVLDFGFYVTNIYCIE